MSASRGFLGLTSGIGLVVANMVGAGVFLSAGFMAQDLTAGQILWSWVVGMGIALLGARAYAEVATHSGRSGGEYRYLSDLAHPFLGTFAGWASLLIGFAAPVAIDAFAVSAFLDRVVPIGAPRTVGTVVILGLALAHAMHLESSRWVQDLLVAVKFLFVLGFAVVGLGWGAHTWPTWTPANPHEGFPFEAFVANQYWVAFAFSGWNAAIYVAAEFRHPKRDVPRALLIGCALVGVLYLVLNVVFVFNLAPDTAIAVASHEETQITLAHLVMERIAGPTGAVITSAVAALVFLSATSAMMLVGPRVVAEMADDGVLPKWLGTREGQPPAGAVWLQAAVALALLHTQSVLDVVKSTSAVLMVFSAATALTVFTLWRRGRDVSPFALVSAVLYAAIVAVLLAVGLTTSPAMALTLGAVLAISVGAHLWRTRGGAA